MEIERINENTIKLYISYLDIEDRGFEREEIWYDRERSEQLFWQMIEEVHHQEDDFILEGPLWIQIQALEKGIEVIVTKSQMLKDENLNLPLLQQEKIDNILGKTFTNSLKELSDENDDQEFSIIVAFKDFEDVIQYSHYCQFIDDDFQNELYYFENKYYLQLEFPQNIDDDQLDDYMSIILEYAVESDISIHVLEEYGKVIFSNHAIAQIRTYFAL